MKELPTRARNCLKNEGILSWDQLHAAVESGDVYVESLLRTPNFGRNTLNILNAAYKDRFGSDIPQREERVVQYYRFDCPGCNAEVRTTAAHPHQCVPCNMTMERIKENQI